MLTSSDFGKDEDSVQSLAKKLEGVERDLSQFQHTIGKLAKLSQGLVDRRHFDSHNITTKQVGCPVRAVTNCTGTGRCQTAGLTPLGD